MQKPRRYRCRSDQDASISGKQHSEDRRTKNENPSCDAKGFIERARKTLMRMQFKRDQTRKDTRTECCEDPSAHRHGRLRFKNAQHVDKETRASEIQDQQNWREYPTNCGSPPCGTSNVEMMKNRRGQRDYR